MFCDVTNHHQIMMFHQYIYRRHDLSFTKYIRRSRCFQVTCTDAFPMRTVTLACRLVKNMVNTHHGRRLLDGFSAQMTVSNDYEDETATKEDIHIDLANSLPLKTLPHAMKVWAAIWSVMLHTATFRHYLVGFQRL